MEPEKVIDPTNMVIEIEITPTKRLSESILVKLLLKIASPKATRSEDIPPQPLNKATVSGIEVIGTFLAVMAPNKLPIAVPIIIQIQEVNETPPSESNQYFGNKPITAKNIAKAANLLASLDDLTFAKPFIPRASNKTERRFITNSTIFGFGKFMIY